VKPARVDTKQKLEQLVQRLNEHQRRVRLVEAGEAPAPTSGGAAAQPAPTAAPVGKAAQGPETLTKEPEAANSSDVTVESVVQQLNAIRGGKSFKDTLVQQELARYFDGLDDSEKEALHAYLKGLAQIVSGQVEAGQAEEPSNHGVETKATGKKTRQIKPNVVKKATQAKPTPATGAPLGAPKEDTTPPAPGPIVPKKR
jgi:hypothetical protein